MPNSNDPLSSLDNFDEGLHVNALPASEIRRRGDRMRRRNTALATVGGVAAAAVFIGTPFLVMSNLDTDDGLQPAPPAPTRTDDGTDIDWLTTIPAEFPLTDGMVTSEGDLGEGDTDAFNFCDVAYPSANSVRDQQTWTFSGDGESTAQRTLQLFADDVAAGSVVDGLAEAVKDCPEQPTQGGEEIIESRLVDFAPGADRTVTFTQQVLGDNGLISQLTVVEATTVGNAILFDSSYGSAGGEDVIADETERLAGRSALVRGAMCVFSADPCSTTEVTPDPENPSAPPVEESAVAIPEDFPLDRGLQRSSDNEVTGPGRDLEATPDMDLCGTPAWSPSDAADRLVVRDSGIEYLRIRELVNFTTVDAAVSAVQDVRDAVAACPTKPSDVPGDGQINLELKGKTGYDSFTWGFHYEQGLGGAVYQFTRVGTAVLLVYANGEMSAQSLQPVADEDVTPATLDLAPEMCFFTAAGC